MTVFCLKQGQGFEVLGGGKPLPKLPLSALPLPSPPPPTPNSGFDKRQQYAI